jgi:ADP-ribose pyrophosphatase YjhB (NUDIX family)
MIRDERFADPDRPTGSGLMAGLHLWVGRLAVGAANRLRPRLSLGVRVVALDESGRRVFLVRHSYLPGLHLPGGAVDAGESCRAALVREAREEGGLKFNDPPALFNVYWNPALGRRDHVVLYVARGVRQPAERSARIEIVGSGFYTTHDLPGDTTPATRRRLAEVLGGAAPSETW